MDEHSKFCEIVEMSNSDSPDSYYEGNELQAATFPVRVLACLGIKTLIGMKEVLLLNQVLICTSNKRSRWTKS